MKAARLPRTRRWTALLGTVAVASALTSLTPGTYAAPDARPRPVQAAKAFTGSKDRITPLDRATPDRASYFVQFRGAGAADLGGRGRAVVRDRRAAVQRQASGMLGAARAVDAKARSIFVVSNAVPGMGVHASPAAVRALAAQPGVVRVSRIVPRTVDNASTANLIKALATWKYPGGTGANVKVGVIDTGLDFTHADFGGVGTPQAYLDASVDSTDPAWRTTLPALGQAKVAGGYDFVGDNYDANPSSPSYQPVPSPDPNPLDCNEHGTHVAGTATGYGVNADGSTFTGDYKALTAGTLMDMRVGPGMAPKAKLYALKVFGCSGSTDAVIPALDWALDPNGDADFSDHLDVINLSLGSPYGQVDDPQNLVVNKLATKGVLAVMSAGNEGDLTDVGGSPGNAVSSLQVASSVDAYQLRDGLTVNAPAGVAGTAAGQMSVAYDWANNGPTGNPVTGDVVAIPGANADGCDPLSTTDAAAVAGKVAWLIWDDDDTTRRCGSAGRSANVRTAGAIGAIFTSGLDVFGGGITGDATIPVFQLPKAWVTALQPAVDAGDLNVTFDGALQATVKDVTPSITDMVSDFSSRGGHGSLGVVKPDVTAPGSSIASAGIGSGTEPLVFDGTSMASPHAAGVAALVKSRHRSWSPLLIKAAIMNTAGHDLYTEPGKQGLKYGPARVGAGRIDAMRASTTQVVAYATSPALGVSASFGVVPADITQNSVTRTRKVWVQNLGKKSTTAKLSYQGVNVTPGVTYTVSPATVTIPGQSRTKVTVTMTVKPKALRHVIDPTMAPSQLGVPRQFVSDASGRLLVSTKGFPALRVPVYGAAKPVSMTTAAVSGTKIKYTGTGVLQGSGAKAYTSITSIMELGAISPKLPVCAADALPEGCTSNTSDKAADLKSVGAGASAAYLWFGIATHSDWANVGNWLIPYVDYDVTGDGVADYETYVQNYPDTDLLLAITVDLTTGDTMDLEPVNFQFADVDTNVFDTNVILLPVDKSLISLPATGEDLSYTVGTWNAYWGVNGDSVGPVSFDPAAPAISTSSELYIDTKQAIPYTVTGPDPVEALVFHLHGAKGARDQVIETP